MLFKEKGRDIEARKMAETVSLYRKTAATVGDYGEAAEGTATLIATVPAKVAKLSEERRQYYFKEASIEGYSVTCRYQNARPDYLVWGSKTLQVNSCEEISNRWLYIIAGYKEGRV